MPMINVTIPEGALSPEAKRCRAHVSFPCISREWEHLTETRAEIAAVFASAGIEGRLVWLNRGEPSSLNGTRAQAQIRCAFRMLLDDTPHSASRASGTRR